MGNGDTELSTNLHKVILLGKWQSFEAYLRVSDSRDYNLNIFSINSVSVSFLMTKKMSCLLGSFPCVRLLKKLRGILQVFATQGKIYLLLHSFEYFFQKLTWAQVSSLLVIPLDYLFLHFLCILCWKVKEISRFLLYWVCCIR